MTDWLPERNPAEELLFDLHNRCMDCGALLDDIRTQAGFRHTTCTRGHTVRVRTIHFQEMSAELTSLAANTDTHHHRNVP